MGYNVLGGFFPKEEGGKEGRRSVTARIVYTCPTYWTGGIQKVKTVEKSNPIFS